MPRKSYSTEDIIKHLRTLEIKLAKGISFEQAAREIGVTSITLSRWKKEYGDLKLDQAKRLKDLEKENSRLKRLLADIERS